MDVVISARCRASGAIRLFLQHQFGAAGPLRKRHHTYATNCLSLSPSFSECRQHLVKILPVHLTHLRGHVACIKHLLGQFPHFCFCYVGPVERSSAAFNCSTPLVIDSGRIVMLSCGHMHGWCVTRFVTGKTPFHPCGHYAVVRTNIWATWSEFLVLSNPVFTLCRFYIRLLCRSNESWTTSRVVRIMNEHARFGNAVDVLAEE